METIREGIDLSGTTEIGDVMNLRGVSTQELERELARRKVGIPEAPQVRKNIVWDDVVNLCASHLNSYTENGYADDDDKEYLYEEAMKAVFGDDVFKYIAAVRR